MVDKNLALHYHEFPTPGKIAIRPTKACETAHDLALAYSPGVAQPCLEIAKDVSKVYRYTSKANLVGVISNGTAVLGLGNIGPEASKPVMEGKGVLFKTFADIDVFDIELNCTTVEHFVETAAALGPTFGGINLEDIRAPECFEIEAQLQERLDIPVFHDDQHGTAIIAAAALLNALELTKRSIDDVHLVISGAGAAAISCARLLTSLGVRRKNLTMVDSRGVVYRGRSDGMNKFKEEFAVDTHCRTLEEVIEEADVFFGLSSAGVLKPEMLETMNENPIVFAMANPDPEIEYDIACAVRPDVYMATGRSDYPNQVNNVLGFPFIFRGALDVRAKGINEEMKLAAVRALADLAKEPIPDSVKAAYGNASFSFGREYLIPKPFDPRVLYSVAPAVAAAAMETGIAREHIDLDEYRLQLKGKLNQGREILRGYHGLARSSGSMRIVFPEGCNAKVLTAAMMAKEEGVAEPILLGSEDEIRAAAEKLDIKLDSVTIIRPAADERLETFAEKYYQARKRRGVTRSEAIRAVRGTHIFANMMLAAGEADGVICGVDQYFPAMVKPILEIVGMREGCATAAGLYLVSVQERLLFCADTAINIEMDSEKLAAIALISADFARSMDVEPRIAMLSYSSFGSVEHPTAQMVREAAESVKQQAPDLVIDGEMQVDVAMNLQIQQETYPFSALKGEANVLIFPDMQSGNIAYKLLQRAAGARVVGPIILGLKAPAYVMQRHASVDEIFNMVTVAAGQAALRR